MLRPDIQPFKPEIPGTGGLNVSNGEDNTNETDQELTNEGQDFWSFFWQNPFNAIQRLRDLNRQTAINKLSSDDTNPLDIQRIIANNPKIYGSLTPDQQEVLINAIEQFNAQQQYDRSIQSIKDSALAQQDAAIATGINPSAYIQGQSAGINAAKAEASHTNPAINRFERRTQMAKTMIGLLGGMASAGVYGGSMAAGRKAVAQLTTDASKEVARIRSAGNIAASRVKLNARVKGKSRYDRFGKFISHEDYYY